MPAMPSPFSPYFRNNIVIPKITDGLIHHFELYLLYLKLHFSLPHQENEMTLLDI